MGNYSNYGDNFYKILLPYLPWLTFIFGVFHLIGDEVGKVDLVNFGILVYL